ncbi:MAG: sensor histidine kinase [Planctomycetota bacterium]
MRAPVQLSEQSLFGYLASTRLPVVSSLSLLIGWLSLAFSIAALGYAALCLVQFGADGLWTAKLSWSGALPGLIAGPLCFLAWWQWRHQHLHRAATVLFFAMFTFTVLSNWPRGALSPAYYLHPLLALLATTCLGVIAGLLMTLGAVGVLLLVPLVGVDASLDALPHAWNHAVSLAALTLASALAGAILNRLVFMLLAASESQRRKNFEAVRALRHRERLLRHALRVETIGDLATMVCHQLRNAFQVLQGHTMLARTSDEEDRERRLLAIEQTLDQSVPLLDQLMRMAHPDDGTTISCELADLLREFQEQARIVLPQCIDLRCEISDDISSGALLNPDGLAHVLWNLVINAKQAIENDGVISLRCGSDSHHVWVEVADSGAGMSEETRARIFDPYFTTKPAGQGTGLGLVAVERFVRASSGTIQVESEAGRGTTFRMRFPLAAGRRAPEDELAARDAG